MNFKRNKNMQAEGTVSIHHAKEISEAYSKVCPKTLGTRSLVKVLANW